MNLPPMIMRVKIDQPDRKVNLWLPLFLIFPVVTIIMLVLLIILSPLILLAAIIFWRFGWSRLLIFSFPVVIGCVFALRGLKVDVNRGRERVLISFS